MSKLHRAAVKLSEYGLYALLLGQPVTGVLTTLFGGRPFALYLWQFPPLLLQDETLRAALHFSHELGAWALAALAVGHAAAGLFHHFVLRDDVLECMAPVIATVRPMQELACTGYIRYLPVITLEESYNAYPVETNPCRTCGIIWPIRRTRLRDAGSRGRGQ